MTPNLCAKWSRRHLLAFFGTDDSGRNPGSNDNTVVSGKQTLKYTDNWDNILISGPKPCLNKSQFQWKSEHTLENRYIQNLKLCEHWPAHTLTSAKGEVMTLAEGYYRCIRDALIFYGEILGGACIWTGLSSSMNLSPELFVIMYSSCLHHSTLATEQQCLTVAEQTHILPTSMQASKHTSPNCC